MKVSKILGCVLSLHLCVIAVLLVQPGCQTGQPPTQTSAQPPTQTSAQTPAQDRTINPNVNRAIRSNVVGASRNSADLIPATRMGEESGLDSAFNSGLDSGSTEIQEPTESVEPIEPIFSGQTVDVAGPGYQSYTIKRGDNLWSLSKRYDVSLNELYAANGLNKNSVLRVGQQIQIPVEGSTATISSATPDAYQPSGYDEATTAYTVQRGDTLSKIAKRYNTTVRALKASNGKSSDMIRVGESLTVPAGGTSTGAPSTSSTPRPTPATSESASSARTATQTHTVKSGEFPAKIARQYGMTTSELLAINGITDPRKLRVGQQLTVSRSGSAVNVDSQIETVAGASSAQPAPVTPSRPTNRTGPSAIRVIEADPLVEDEFNVPDAEPELDDAFNNAIEIPVIRLEE